MEAGENPPEKDFASAKIRLRLAFGGPLDICNLSESTVVEALE
jgi:hypothetical protein